MEVPEGLAGFVAELDGRGETAEHGSQVVTDDQLGHDGTLPSDVVRRDTNLFYCIEFGLANRDRGIRMLLTVSPSRRLAAGGPGLGVGCEHEHRRLSCRRA